METTQNDGKAGLLDRHEISIGSLVVVSRDQLSCQLVGEAVILNLRTGVYFGLNSVGARIWALLQEPIQLGDVIDTVLDEYDVEPDRCQRELLDLLIELKARELIEIEDEAVD